MIHETFPFKKANSNITLTTYIRNPIMGTGPRPTVIVCPGGGYGFLSPNEGEPIAMRFNSLGYNAFVLSYSTQENTPAEQLQWPEPLYDIAAAVLCIKDNADKWDVDPEQLFVCGFSAGGHLAAMYATCWSKPFLQEKFNRPMEDFRIKAAVLAYPVIDFTAVWSLVDWRTMWLDEDPVGCFNHFMFGTNEPTEEALKEKSPVYLVDENTVPCFIAHAQDDSLVQVEGSLNMAKALRAKNIPFELHVFQTGNHGFALSDKSSAGFDFEITPEVSEWIRFADIWLQKHVKVSLSAAEDAPFPMIAR